MRPRVAIVGGGFIGCEIAAAARSHGLAVTIVESEPLLLQRVLTQELADSLINLHRDHGVTVMCGSAVTAVLGETRARGLSLADGSAVDADLIVVGVGTVPEIEWLQGLRSSWTMGSLRRHRYDHWWTTCMPPAISSGGQPGKVATVGDRSIGPRRAHRANSRPETYCGLRRGYAHAEYGWSDQYDRQFQMIGSFGSRVELVLGDGRDGPYVALSGDRNIVTGAIALDYHKRHSSAPAFWWQIVHLASMLCSTVAEGLKKVFRLYRRKRV